MPKYPKVKIQSDDIYRAILRNLCESCSEGGCASCIVNDQRSGADWLRSMGIHINVVLWGSVVPKGISKFIVNRRFRRNTTYITHPGVVLWASAATAASLILLLKFVILVPVL